MDRPELDPVKSETPSGNSIVGQMLKEQMEVLERMSIKERITWIEVKYNEILVRIFGNLLPHAANAIGLTSEVLQNHVKSVTVMFTPLINARRDPQSGAIQVYVGLMSFFHTMITVLMARLGLGILERGTAPRIVYHPQVPFENACALALRVMNDFYDGKLCEARPEGTLLRELTHYQVRFWGLFLDYSESFVVAHEIGHLALLICPDKMDLDVALAVSQAVLRGQADMSEGERRRNLEMWTDEIAADLFALRLLPTLAEDNFQRILAYSSAELVFLLMDMLEQFCRRVKGISPPIGDHPPSNIRLSMLRLAVLPSNPPEILQLGLSFQDQIQNMLNALCPVDTSLHSSEFPFSNLTRDKTKVDQAPMKD